MDFVDFKDETDDVEKHDDFEFVPRFEAEFD